MTGNNPDGRCRRGAWPSGMRLTRGTPPRVGPVKICTNQVSRARSEVGEGSPRPVGDCGTGGEGAGPRECVDLGPPASD